MNKLIIANWKMNPETYSQSSKLFENIKKCPSSFRKITIIIAPPIIFLQNFAEGCKSKHIKFAAQNAHYLTKSSDVGTTSITQIRSVGVEYVLLGHSANRSSGETNEDVALKVKVALSEKIIPVIFVGENDRDASGRFLAVVRKQIVSVLAKITKSRVKDIIFVYEPSWAISTAAHKQDAQNDNQKMTSNEIHKMILFVRKVIAEFFDSNTAKKAKILYGGSVNKENIAEVLSVPEIVGVAVGSASLNSEEFCEILRAANKV